jgi:hypothetical protein
LRSFRRTGYAGIIHILQIGFRVNEGFGREFRDGLHRFRGMELPRGVSGILGKGFRVNEAVEAEFREGLRSFHGTRCAGIFQILQIGFRVNEGFGGVSGRIAQFSRHGMRGYFHILQIGFRVNGGFRGSFGKDCAVFAAWSCREEFREFRETASE